MDLFCSSSRCWEFQLDARDLSSGGIEVVRQDTSRRQTETLRAHWATPVVADGAVYGFSGRNAGDTHLVCADWKNGTIRWHEPGLGRGGLVLVDGHLLLNSIAALLPWFEVFCGILLVGGIAVRGSALLLLGMLVPFTWVVIHRAWELHLLQAIPFCAVKFDCGCGTGEVFICRKIAENSLLMLLATWLSLKSSGRLCARFNLAG